jgi:hypothetical protein
MELQLRQDNAISSVTGSVASYCVHHVLPHTWHQWCFSLGHCPSRILRLRRPRSFVLLPKSAIELNGFYVLQ